MNIESLYEKKLISMNNKTIKYSICESNQEPNYGVQISEFVNGVYKEKVIENISPHKTFVYNLITYLSENVIDTVHFKDIVEDYIFAQE